MTVPARTVPALTVPARASFTTTVCTDGREFGQLSEEWGDLHRRCTAATPFQHHAWLHSWWTSYGTPGRLRVVLVRESGRLVAAAALHRVRGVVPVLTPLGGAITDFSDVLLDDRSEAAAAVLTEALAGLARSAVIDFREVRPEAAVLRVRALWDGPSRLLPDSMCLELPAVPMDRLVQRLPSSRAQRTRAKLRKLDAIGIGLREVGAEEVPAALDRLLTLHQRQWQDRGVTPEHLSERFAGHLKQAVAPMVACGDARLTEFSIDGEVVASDLTLISPRLAGGYLYGADPGLRTRKVDVATLLLRHCAQEASTGGQATLSMLRGTEPYKNHWCPDPVGNHRVLLARRRFTPAIMGLTAQIRGRIWARDTLRGRL
ncbi:GNAT family N-acetyltransferase [Streptomyces beijiangensis]|uniref:GNAT family N-acetyltransferase n=1 Tax=Streptomyces beijiangensis TaxID=163361 RepID=A0A939F884_9ACTN|nr:GNAT family N-acetyltransferase [Streptomyces beijiangensis]MBO0514416.1 GNAT family N-acetyltransferase [Streptomyces beijiangensis]